MHTYMYLGIMNCYIYAKSSKKNERRQANETFYKLEMINLMHSDHANEKVWHL